MENGQPTREMIMKKMAHCEFDDQELIKMVNALHVSGENNIAAFICYANALRLLVRQEERK